MKQATRLRSAGKTPVKPAKTYGQPGCRSGFNPLSGDLGPSDKYLISTSRANFCRKGFVFGYILKKMTSIRPITPEEIPELLVMIRELADFEQLSHEVTATVADYERELFGDSTAAAALVAEHDGALVGYAIYFSTFSSFLGKQGVWLEDLYVRPPFRGLGIGKALLKAVGSIATERGAGRYEWSVLDWNTNAIELYKRLGGRIMDEWRIVRLTGNELANLPDK